ncbi:peptide chain release factor N(5)-glutamine methyltransferase [Corallococcus exiguus]|uniref:peptide chain release factor N(5)-glutamine methyltransferase n=1 Tax=Corallococcus TaxID=83461 RepID=UPI000EC1948E|nr:MULTISPECIES: peptide chain release factor N(5)-glutamine methyltransferase [Corallococcus]NNB90276.1 peptide chain release factor N(5)-glutamine methyltransferase [Corallococcus exiguus]NNB98114.1 peptide chain release factor N(5)-glutamine methyltransferase [Corallococcus exiguus]NNC06961.1 peptide chain release factor N(5)-glutamine methyltransferase [Corallococcus exiguus]NPC50780.1 peptide chain release factor N(5)-glutamine methyltransferase [Corallococcus exiguus]RKH75243.1 peptide c
MSDVWTIRRLLTWTTGHFEKRGVDAPRLTTEILLAHVLKTGRVRLYVDLDRPLSKDELAAFKALIERRMAGEPTNYLTGTKEFYNRPFKVDARVLIPRPETELLVEAVLHSVPKDAPSRVLDVCTGSGCIAISVAAERPQATVLATDLSKDACALALENAQALGVAERVSVLEGDLFSPLPPDATFRVVVSNPPYIDSGDIAGLSAEVRREPRLALDGGPDGLVALRRVIEGARRVLEPGGLLALEMGETQGSAVLELLRAAGYSDARVEKDLERRERMAFGTQPAA